MPLEPPIRFTKPQGVCALINWGLFKSVFKLTGNSNKQLAGKLFSPQPNTHNKHSEESTFLIIKLSLFFE